jgi:hypothetical protein
MVAKNGTQCSMGIYVIGGDNQPIGTYCSRDYADSTKTDITASAIGYIVKCPDDAEFCCVGGYYGNGVAKYANGTIEIFYQRYKSWGNIPTVHPWQGTSNINMYDFKFDPNFTACITGHDHAATILT